MSWRGEWWLHIALAPLIGFGLVWIAMSFVAWDFTVLFVDRLGRFLFLDLGGLASGASWYFLRRSA